VAVLFDPLITEQRSFFNPFSSLNHRITVKRAVL